MAARGSESKSEILAKLMEVFPNAFVNGKELRIPMQENGEIVEIKVTLTAAKDVISTEIMDNVTADAPAKNKIEMDVAFEPSAEETKLLQELLAKF